VDENCGHKFIFKRYFGGYSKVDGRMLNGIELYCTECNGTKLVSYGEGLKILGLNRKGDLED
jgi:hypothetical protein